MSRSLADWDASKLSDDARAALEGIAQPLADGAREYDVAAKLGITTGELKRRLELLAAELEAQTGGADVRPLTHDEYVALRESIREHGQLVPAIVHPLTGEILAGKNRQRACTELGLELWTVPYQGPRHLARWVILAENFVRRQLTTADRRRAVVAELKNDAERSDRAIAAAIGVSPTTVGKARDRLEREGRLSKLDSRTSQDGRTRPASQPEREPRRDPETRLEHIVEELRSLAALEDREHAHARADLLLCEGAKLLGGHALVQAWEQSGPRYYRP